MDRMPNIFRRHNLYKDLAVIAVCFPARRAAGIEPTRAIRVE
jgi:hypothetical protein